MRLSVGAVTTSGRDLGRYAQLAERASEMKRFVKTAMDSRLSAFAFDRRR
jgi:hypothetical protein